MKRILALLLTMTLVLAGCGNHTAEQTPTPVPTPTVTPEPTPTPTPPPPPTVSTLAVCGDAMSHMPVTDDCLDPETGEYDYSHIIAAAKPYIQDADYAVCNLETTLSAGNYTGYPCFKSPDAMAKGLQECGFDMLLTAHNHCLDAGFSGLCRTLDVLDEIGMPHVGTSRTEEEYTDGNIVLADVGGISVAFLGYTYGTNGIPMAKDAPWSVNLFNTDYLTTLSTLDTEKLLYDIDRAKALNPDLVAVMIHWGVEYHHEQNSYQNKIADFLISNGVDLILGGHSHVIQPIEMRTVTTEAGEERTGLVCFSLGNFFSNQNDEPTRTTAVLTLELTRDNVTGEASVTDWTYAPMYMSKATLADGHSRHLLDAYSDPDDPDLQHTIELCHKVWGPEHDPRAAAVAQDEQ